MECPKCGREISKNDLVCPNCKKVLKIVCPECKTINSKNICKHCGKVLITKCNKCSKINILKNRYCTSCGYDNEISVIQAESNTDGFALLRIDFPNMRALKDKLGTFRLFQKFKKNLDATILAITNSAGVRRQIIDDKIYVIRFNKDYTITASANSAILTTIEILKAITRINVKLLKKKGIALKCNCTIMKRFADRDPYNIETGFSANLIYQTQQKELKALSAFQVISDDSMFQYYKEKYKIDSLNSAMVNGKMKRFYELDLKESVNISEIIREISIQEDKLDDDIPEFVKTSIEESDKNSYDILNKENNIADEQVFDIEKIEFDEMKCEFIKVENINVLDCVAEILNSIPKGVLSIKANKIYQPYSLKLLSTVENSAIYENIIPITCNNSMKYAPYAFFKELISSVLNYTISHRLINTNDFSMFANMDKTDMIKNLITCKPRQLNDLFKTKEDYFNIFLTFLEAIPNTLIYVEDFEKIDISSLSLLEELFDRLDEFNVSFLLTYDQEYSLHRKMHFLLSRPYYTEIELFPASFDKIINLDPDYYKNVLNDFYFQRIAKYSCGSSLFLDHAIQYLIEAGVYNYIDNTLLAVNSKVIIIPAKLDNLIKRRINLLKNDKDTFYFLATLLCLGARVDENTIETLEIKNWRNIAETLCNMGYTYFYNGCIYFSNYNTLLKCMLETIRKNDLISIGKTLLEKVFEESMPCAEKAFIYQRAENPEQTIAQWENLANLNLSFGDFASYLNCSSEILKTLDTNKQSWDINDYKTYRTALFENVSENIYDYNPEYNTELTQNTLSYLKEKEDKSKYIDLCIRMIQGSMVCGNYIYAKDLMHDVLSQLNGFSIDPAVKNFNPNLLILSLIYVKILFFTGSFASCKDIGYNILNVVDTQTIDSIDLSNAFIDTTELKFLIAEFTGYILMIESLENSDVKSDLNRITKLIDFIPESYQIFIELQNILKGHSVELKIFKSASDVFSGILFHMINAFHKHINNATDFAKEIYKSKLLAKEAYMYPFELFCDLMIGYAYIKLKCYKKASSILQKITTTAKEKGFAAIEYLSCVITGELYLAESRFEAAYSILNNNEILMQKNGFTNINISLLSKINMYKTLICLGKEAQAQYCYNQAIEIQKKYNLNFNLNIDINKFMSENATIAQKQILSSDKEIKEDKLTQEYNQETSNEDDEKLSDTTLEETTKNVVFEQDYINPDEFFNS